MYPLATASSPYLYQKENINLSTMASQKVYGNAPFFTHPHCLAGWLLEGREFLTADAACKWNCPPPSPSEASNEVNPSAEVESSDIFKLMLMFFFDQLLSQILQKVKVFFLLPLLHQTSCTTHTTICCEPEWLVVPKTCWARTNVHRVHIFFGLQWSINLC